MDMDRIDRDGTITLHIPADQAATIRNDLITARADHHTPLSPASDELTTYLDYAQPLPTTRSRFGPAEGLD